MFRSCLEVLEYRSWKVIAERSEAAVFGGRDCISVVESVSNWSSFLIEQVTGLIITALAIAFSAVEAWMFYARKAFPTFEVSPSLVRHFNAENNSATLRTLASVSTLLVSLCSFPGAPATMYVRVVA